MSIQTAFPRVVFPRLTPATSSRRRPRRLMVRAKGPFFCGFVMLNAFMWMSFRLLYFLLDSTGNFRELKDYRGAIDMVNEVDPICPTFGGVVTL